MPENPPRFLPWIAVDPEKADARFPRFAECSEPLRVVLNPGDMLYLPALYYHHVRQMTDDQRRVIAVNFWYDMVYDHKYTYFQFMRAISKSLDCK